MPLHGVDISAISNTTTTTPLASHRPKMPSAATASPFLLRVQDVEDLAHSDGFSILREHLAVTYTYE